MTSSALGASLCCSDHRRGDREDVGGLPRPPRRLRGAAHLAGEGIERHPSRGERRVIAEDTDVPRHRGSDVGDTRLVEQQMSQRIVDVDIRRCAIGDLPGKVAADPGARDDRLGEAVRRESIRAVHARRRHLADRIETSQRGATVESGTYATARIVRCGCDRDAIDGGVESDLPTRLGDRGKPLMEPLAHVRGVEVHVVIDAAGAFGHPATDRCRDDIAWGEVLERVHPGHHPLAGGVEQDGPFATHGLGHEGLLAPCVGATPHHSGMELDELEIGHAEACSQCHRQPVTGDRRRVRGGGEHLPVAAGRDHHRPGGHDADRDERSGVVGLSDAHADRLRLAIGGRAHHQIERECVTHHLDAGTDRALVERSLHLGAGAVATGVHDAVVAVAAFTGEGDVGASLLGVERGAEAHQVADRLRGLGHQLTDHPLVTETSTGVERVADVILDRVTRIEHPGEATLGPLGGPCRQHVLGDHQHAANRADRQRSRQPRCPGAEHDDVDIELPRRRVVPPTSPATSRFPQPGSRGTTIDQCALEVPGDPGWGNHDHSAVADGVPMAIMRSTERRARSAMSRSTNTSSVPSRSDRSSFAGVIIFMYLHTAARFTGTKSVTELTFSS